MPDAIFISYSRRDSEFVIKLASDLHHQVAGVWLDQSDLAVGQKWRDQLLKGIRECKVFLLVLSPDSAASPYVREEISEAVRLKKTIMPVLYRPVVLTGELDELVSSTQFLDLSQGSYADNFQKLVDGLVEAGIIRHKTPKPFLFQPVKTDWNAVIARVPGWAGAWGVGWAVFWFLIIAGLAVFNAVFDIFPASGDLKSITLVTIAGGLGGAAGGLLAGLVTMVALRRYAPSITWKHIVPTVPIWIINGPVGLILSVVIITLLSAAGMLAFNISNFDLMTSEAFADQILTVLDASSLSFILLGLLALFVFAILIWFFDGIIAGWLAVLYVRRLEPGIQRTESFLVAFGWGVGAALGAISSLIMIVLGSLLFGV